MSYLSRRRFLHYVTLGTGAWVWTRCANPPAPPVPTQEPLIGFVADPTATATRLPTVIPLSETASLPPSATAVPPNTATPLPSATLRKTITPAPTSTATLAPTNTPTVFPTNTIAPTAMPIPTNTLAPTSTPFPTATLTPSPQPPTPTPTPTPEPCLDPGLPPPAESPLVGLHASADPQIIPVERCMYLDLRPSLIKVLTFHPPEHIYKLAVTQPNATWIVRIFFKWEGRVGLDSQYFIESVVGDTRRTLNALAGRSVILEIHNEPNLTPEGWSLSWANGAEFSAFVSPVIEALRREFPNVPLMFPAVSPGGAIEGIRYPHTTFLEEARPAVEACDALGVHFYWAAGDPLESAIGQLDTYINQFPSKPLWITEASYLSGDLSDADIAAQYLRFIELVRARPAIRGVVFFVASALDPTFGNEVWLGKNIAPIVGNR